MCIIACMARGNLELAFSPRLSRAYCPGRMFYDVYNTIIMYIITILIFSTVINAKTDPTAPSSVYIIIIIIVYIYHRAATDHRQRAIMVVRGVGELF